MIDEILLLQYYLQGKVGILGSNCIVFVWSQYDGGNIYANSQLLDGILFVIL